MQSIHSFSIKTPRDVLAKLGRERDRFIEASSFHSQQHKYQYDHAINFCLTAWQQIDWIWRYLESNGKDVKAITGCESYDEFHKHVRRECIGLQICYEICNGNKHFIASRLDNQVVLRTTETVYETDGLTRPLTRPLVRPIVRPLVKKHHAKISVSVKDKGSFNFLDVCNEVWEYWSLYFQRPGL